MNKVNVMYEIGLENLFDNQNKDDKNIKTNKGKHVKVSDQLFDFMVKEGLIKKTKDGYIFIGDHKDLLEMKK